MLIDLYELLQENNGERKIKPEIDMSDFKYNKNSYKIKGYDLTLNLHNEGKKHILCKCTGNITLVMPCDECLCDVDKEISIDYFKDLDMNKTSEQRIADLDEVAYLEGTEFDFEIFIYNEILVNLPMKVLCKPDCKGICNKCGANLNFGPCGCDNTELDPRMSKILDVFNQFKEV